MNGPLVMVAGAAAAILVAAARTYHPAHISTVPTDGTWANQFGRAVTVDADGICHCDPQPDSSPIGECPQCHRLDNRKAST